jgi:hypothetical protein
MVEGLAAGNAWRAQQRQSDVRSGLGAAIRLCERWMGGEGVVALVLHHGVPPWYIWLRRAAVASMVIVPIRSPKDNSILCNG